MLSAGLEQYLFTIGIVIGFIGMAVSFAFSRRDVFSVLKKSGVTRKHLVIAFLITVLFVGLEVALVKPTQQLFFDDVIYQGGAASLLASGQAWMCNYGTPTQCFSGQIFHEPIGTSFNIALGFALFGASRATAFNTFIFMAALSVLATFFAAVLIFKRIEHALFAELLMALSPIILVWAAPTSSDLLVMAYSTIAVFAAMVFINKKSIWTFAFMLFSLSVLVYMKVNALLYIVIIAIAYILLDSSSIRKSIKENTRLIKRNILNTKALIVILLFVLTIVPMAIYANTQRVSDTYGYVGTYIPQTCSKSNVYINATGAIDFQNFKANLCSNVFFWFNAYQDSNGTYHIMQPVLFTALAIAGFVVLAVYRRRLAIAFLVWFGAIFLLYTAFYAGSVLFGVDWRFMLALIPPVSILGGFAIGSVLDATSWLTKSRIIYAAVAAIIIGALLYSLLSMYGSLSIQPSGIMQAEPARLYENFIYGNVTKIPASCLVFSFDPTLFLINNRSSTQFGDLANLRNNLTEYQNYTQRYGCLVIDYGFWCHTSLDNVNSCQTAMNEFSVKPIAEIYDTNVRGTFGLYTINGFNSSR